MPTIVQQLLTARQRPSKWTAVRFKRHRTWLELSWQDYYRTCEAVGLSLAALGVKAGDRVAVLSSTRWEWAALDLGTMGLGAVIVPIYESNRSEEVEWILNHSGARVLVVENQAQLRKWEQIAKRINSVESVICIDAGESSKPVLDWDSFLHLGLEKFGASSTYFEERIHQVTPETLATVVYTSGTTGEPKGAMLTHQQIMSEVEDITRAFPISPVDSSLCFLPFAHVLGRTEMWLNLHVGFTLNFAQSIERLRENIREVKPTVMIGVPRIFEKIHAGLITSIEGSALRKRLFHWLSDKESFLPQMAADLLIYRQLREHLGGRLRFVVSGSAPLEPKLAEFFHRAGLLLLEGYGLTETTAAICANTPTAYEFGTVGRPLTDVEIKLDSDGEILVRSKKVMTGYYRDESATQQAFDGDGFFRTGDIGEWTPRGFLRIIDRKKDLIKTAGGKYVAPQKLENLLKLSPLISQVLIHGDRRKYVVALITLNEPYIKKLARENNWTYKDYRSLIQREEVVQLVRKEVARANSQLASYETIKNFKILPQDFSIERGELTPSLKVKRRVCDEKFKTEIDALY